MDKIISLLKNLGLDEKETSLYIASLTLGEANMTELAKKAALKRPTAYLAFNALEKKGLMGSFKTKKGMHFVPTKPHALLEKTKNQVEEIESILPQLKALGQQGKAKPKIYYYEGKEGYVNAVSDSLNYPNSLVRHIGSLAEIHEVIGFEYDLKHYLPERIKKNISFRALYFKSQLQKEITDRSHAKELRQIKYLPEEHSYNTSMLIYGDKVAIFSTKDELITVIIESKDIAESEREKFDLIWDLIPN